MTQERNVSPTGEPCPLCSTPGTGRSVAGADARRYHLCEHCSLIFADPSHRLSPEEERQRYGTHQNSIDNEGYVRFLRRVLDPVLPHLDAGMRGLDYGCGPGPTLSILVQQHGLACDDYDPFFAPNSLRPPYDFIFCTECFEHFHSPAEEILRLRGLLKSGGLLGVMTACWTTLEEFGRWHYTRDATHVSFFHAATFAHVRDRFGFIPLLQDDDRVHVLRGDSKVPRARSCS